jgi:hypothetical protein
VEEEEVAEEEEEHQDLDLQFPHRQQWDKQPSTPK